MQNSRSPKSTTTLSESVIKNSDFKLTFEQFVKLDLDQLAIAIIGTDNEYAFKYTLYKVQVKHPQIQTFYCGRRFNEFYALHKVLKIKYSNLDLPQFPSKHEIFNRIEKRKIGFHLLLNKLVEIAIQHPVISPNILKLLYYFLTRELSGKEKQSILKSDGENCQMNKSSFEEEEEDITELEKTLKTVMEEEPVKKNSIKKEEEPIPIKKTSIKKENTKEQIDSLQVDYGKEIKNYAGNVLMRFSDDEEWVQFYGKIKSGTLQLFNHISQNYFGCQIFLFQAIMEMEEDTILISHRFDYRKIQFKAMDYSLLQIWYNQLKIASTEILINDDQQDDFNPVGKIQINIREAINLRNLVPDSFILVRLKFKPFQCQTKQHVFTENPQWRQDFIMPINDSYGVIVLELVNEVQDGLLSRKIKQTVIGTAEIQIADILSYHSDTKFQKIVLNLTLSEETNVNPIQQLFVKKSAAHIGDKQPQLIITLRNMSSPVSLFAAPPIHSYEGDKLEPDLTLMKMHIIRFKRIFSLVSQLALNMEDIVDQKYPRLTFFVFTNMCLFIYFADVNYILSYLVFGLILIMIYQHPCVHPVLSQFFGRYMLCELNSYYLTPQLFTSEQKDLKKNTQTLDKVIKFENNEIKIEVEEDENEAKESLYQKIRAIKKQFFIIQVQMTYFSNFTEKILNLFTWKEYQRTMYFFTIIMIVYCFLRILPLRYMMLVGSNLLYLNTILVVNEWFDGKVVFKKRSLHNLKIGTVMVEYIIKRHAPELTKLDNILDQELPKTEAFRMKLVNELRLHLQVQLSNEESNKYQTGNELVRDLMTISEKLKFMGIIDNTFVRDQLYYELRSKGKYTLKPHYILFYTFTNFIYNIPSQYYRLRRPRLLKK